MPLSSNNMNRRIPEALSTSRGKPAGVSDGNGIQTMPGNCSGGALTERYDAAVCGCGKIG